MNELSHATQQGAPRAAWGHRLVGVALGLGLAGAAHARSARWIQLLRTGPDANDAVWLAALLGAAALVGVLTAAATLTARRLPWLAPTAAGALLYGLFATMPSSVQPLLPSVHLLQSQVFTGRDTFALVIGMMSVAVVWSLPSLQRAQHGAAMSGRVTEDVEAAASDRSGHWWSNPFVGTMLGVGFAMAVQAETLLSLMQQIQITSASDYRERVWVILGIVLLIGVATAVVVLSSSRMPWLSTTAAAWLAYGVLAALPTVVFSVPPYPGWLQRLSHGGSLTTTTTITAAIAAAAVWGWWQHLRGSRNDLVPAPAHGSSQASS